MVTPTGGANSSGTSSNQPANSLPSTQPYTGTYVVSPGFRAFWQNLFNTQLSDQDVSQLTDTFVQNVVQQMNQVMNDALANMKRIEQEREENS